VTKYKQTFGTGISNILFDQFLFDQYNF